MLIYEVTIRRNTGEKLQTCTVTSHNTMRIVFPMGGIIDGGRRIHAVELEPKEYASELKEAI
jgi:hypothetical protein